jgi:hypothetical protein
MLCQAIPWNATADMHSAAPNWPWRTPQLKAMFLELSKNWKTSALAKTNPPALTIADHQAHKLTGNPRQGCRGMPNRCHIGRNPRVGQKPCMKKGMQDMREQAPGGKPGGPMGRDTRPTVAYCVASYTSKAARWTRRHGYRLHA